MWYHYLIILVALYFVATGIYNVIQGPKTTYYIATSAIQIAVGAIAAYWAYSAATAPPPMMIPTVGGGRRRR